MKLLGAIRARAWLTRRQEYGPRGHAGSYARSRAEADAVSLERCRNLIAELVNDAILSEGQGCKATGLDRISLRLLCEQQQNFTGVFYP